MKKILYITSFLPYNTPFAGSKTVYNILEYMSKNSKIDIYSFVNEIEIDYIDSFINYINKHKNIFLLKIKKVNRFDRLLKAITFFYLPIVMIMRFDIIFILKMIFKQKNYKDYDIIYVEWSQSIMFGYIISLILKKKLIYSIADVITQSMERKFLTEKNFFKKLFYWFEYKKSSIFEKIFLSKAYKILVQSSKDKDLLIRSGLKKNNIEVINPYFNSNMNFQVKSLKNKFNVLFWGAMNREENIDAVEYYLNNIHYIIKNKLDQSYTFMIAGANPPKDLIDKYSNDKNVIITGFLRDPSDIFNECAVSVVPLRKGAGIKVKTLESLYMGLPTISTDVGAEGIELSEEDGLYVVDIEKFSDKILEIYDKKIFYKKEQIHKKFRDKFSFKKTIKIIQKIIDDI